MIDPRTVDETPLDENPWEPEDFETETEEQETEQISVEDAVQEYEQEYDEHEDEEPAQVANAVARTPEKIGNGRSRRTTRDNENYGDSWKPSPELLALKDLMLGTKPSPPVSSGLAQQRKPPASVKQIPADKVTLTEVTVNEATAKEVLLKEVSVKEIVQATPRYYHGPLVNRSPEQALLEHKPLENRALHPSEELIIESGRYPPKPLYFGHLPRSRPVPLVSRSKLTQ